MRCLFSWLVRPTGRGFPEGVSERKEIQGDVSGGAGGVKRPDVEHGVVYRLIGWNDAIQGKMQQCPGLSSSAGAQS